MKILLFRSSSVVEQPAVNRWVVGSNPTCGAIKSIVRKHVSSIDCLSIQMYVG